jgi:hypothetical protein
VIELVAGEAHPYQQLGYVMLTKCIVCTGVAVGETNGVGEGVSAGIVAVGLGPGVHMVAVPVNDHGGGGYGVDVGFGVSVCMHPAH